jgi:hypothetical protein
LQLQARTRHFEYITIKGLLPEASERRAAEMVLGGLRAELSRRELTLDTIADVQERFAEKPNIKPAHQPQKPETSQDSRRRRR